MSKRRRAYCTRVLKENYSYSLEQIADVYGISIATVRRWIRVDGLPRIPGVRPYLVHSSELKRFLDDQRKARSYPCAEHEVFCFRCREPRTPGPGTGTTQPLPNGTTRFGALCADCGSKMFRTIGRAKWSRNHPLAAYLRDASEQHNGVCPRPPECPLGSGGPQ